MGTISCATSTSNEGLVETASSATKSVSETAKKNDADSTDHVISFDTSLFRIVEVLGKRVSILVPQEFSRLSEQMLDLKYPKTSGRPTEVYSNTSGSINIGFATSDKPASQNSLTTLQQELLAQMRALKVEDLQSEVRLINNRKILIIEFVSQAIDTKIYNLVVITDLWYTQMPRVCMKSEVMIGFMTQIKMETTGNRTVTNIGFPARMMRTEIILTRFLMCLLAIGNQDQFLLNGQMMVDSDIGTMMWKMIRIRISPKLIGEMQVAVAGRQLSGVCYIKVT